ncbi:MazG family protein, partial [Myxococcota bacterium]|nr:MazG family protein [Myxococcota bacterium]
EKEGAFTLDDAISSIVEKLILRHPHIFGNSPRRHEPDEALWEQAKLKEKQNASLMDDIPHTLPALMKADKIQRRAASVGFDWPDHQGPMDKVTEEFEELKEVIALQNQTAIEEEMGDLLFAVANLSRHLKINPETALMNANKKFQKRFRLMETMTGNDKRPLVTLSLEQQDLYWVQAKHRIREEKKSR